MKRNIGRPPTNSELNYMIKSVVQPEEIEKEKQAEEKNNKPLTTEQRFKTVLLIRKQKIAYIITGSYIGFKK